MCTETTDFRKSGGVYRVQLYTEPFQPEPLKPLQYMRYNEYRVSSVHATVVGRNYAK